MIPLVRAFNRTVLALGALTICVTRTSAQPLTARQVIERVKSNLGVPWTTPTVDTIKGGDLDTPVTGIAVTMMATLDVLQRAANEGLNLVITHEPTFFDHLDSTKSLTISKDPVALAKLQFIADHHMVVWRFHDHAHRMKPDIIVNGVVRQLGWASGQDPKAPWRIKLPETTLATLVDTIRSRLGAHAVRVVGDPAMRLTNVVLIPGAAGFTLHRLAMRDGWGEVLVVGEAREWETVEYIDDAIAAGQKKALVLIGHIPSEQPGMDDATTWLRGFVREVPVKFVAAKDPFWGSR